MERSPGGVDELVSVGEHRERRGSCHWRVALRLEQRGARALDVVARKRKEACGVDADTNAACEPPNHHVVAENHVGRGDDLKAVAALMRRHHGSEAIAAYGAKGAAVEGEPRVDLIVLDDDAIAGLECFDPEGFADGVEVVPDVATDDGVGRGLDVIRAASCVQAGVVFDRDEGTALDADRHAPSRANPDALKPGSRDPHLGPRTRDVDTKRSESSAREIVDEDLVDQQLLEGVALDPVCRPGIASSIDGQLTNHKTRRPRDTEHGGNLCDGYKRRGGHACALEDDS